MEKIFKAKRLDNGEWHVFNMFEMASTMLVDPSKAFISAKGVAVLDRDTICQYTGINDSEGNRIFEGDEFDCDGICAFKDGAFRYVTEKNNKSLTAGCLNLKLKLTGRNIHDN
jgi:hypothetical protein